MYFFLIKLEKIKKIRILNLGKHMINGTHTDADRIN